MVNRQPLETGAMLGDEYRVQGVLGQGGFGITYDVHDTRLDTRRAIKEYFPYEMSRREGATQITPYSGIHNDQFVWGRSRFVDEGKLIARFSHPGIVKVIRLFEENNTAYMVLDFVDGETLEKWAQRHPHPAVDLLMGMIQRLLDALEVIHTANILHRDISPDNVMLRPSGEPVYIDFGAARSDLGSRTRTFVMIREGYSPSEQHAGDGVLQGPWTDIYSLGATLYRVVTGLVPPSGGVRSAGDMLVPATEAAAGRYPARVLEAIDRSLRIRIRERPQSVAEFRQAIFDTPVITVPPEPTPPPLPPSPRSEPGFLGRLFRRQLDDPAGKGGNEDGQRTAIAGDDKQHAAEAADHAAWAETQIADTIVAYRDYRTRFPSGQHAVEAAGRMSARGQVRLIKSLQCPGAPVYALAFSADGHMLLSGATDGHIRQWSIPDGSSKTMRKAHARPVRMVSFLPDARFAISAGDDRAARLWSVADGTEVRAFDRHDSEVLSAAVTTDGLGIITGTRLRSVMRWDVNTGRALAAFDQHNGAVTAIATSPTGQQALTGGQDRVLRLHAMPSLALARPLGILADAITAIAVSPDGDYAVTGSAGGLVQIWDLRGPVPADGRPGSPLHTLRGHDEAVRSVTYLAKGALVASVARDGSLRLWNTSNGASLLAIKAHPEPAYALAVDHGRGVVATAGASGSICFWDVSDLTERR